MELIMTTEQYQANVDRIFTVREWLEEKDNVLYTEMQLAQDGDNLEEVRRIVGEHQLLLKWYEELGETLIELGRKQETSASDRLAHWKALVQA